MCYTYIFVGMYLSNKEYNPNAGYYKYYDFTYKYDGCYLNYTINTEKLDEYTNRYNIYYYFKIIDNTERNKQNNYFECDYESTTDKNMAYEYYTKKYINYQPTELYFTNNNNNCNIISNGETYFVYVTFCMIILSIIFFSSLIYCMKSR